MLKIYISLAIILKITNAQNLDDPDAFIETLPDNEKEVLLKNIARRINDEVKPQPHPDNQRAFEVPDEVLEAQDTFVRRIMREESENILNLRRQAPAITVENEPSKTNKSKRSVVETTTDGSTTVKTSDVSKSVTEQAPKESIPEQITYRISVAPLGATVADILTTSTLAAETTISSAQVRSAAKDSVDVKTADVVSESTTIHKTKESLSEAVKGSDLPPSPLASRRSNRPLPASFFNSLRRTDPAYSGTSQAIATANAVATAGNNIGPPYYGESSPIYHISPVNHERPLVDGYNARFPINNQQNNPAYPPYRPPNIEEYPANYYLPGNHQQPNYLPNQGGNPQYYQPTNEVYPNNPVPGNNQPYGPIQENLPPVGLPEANNMNNPANLIHQYDYSPENAYYNPSNVFRPYNSMPPVSRMGVDAEYDPEREYLVPVHNFGKKNAFYNPQHHLASDQAMDSPWLGPVGTDKTVESPLYFPYSIKDSKFDYEYADFGGFFGGLSRSQAQKLKQMWRPVPKHQHRFKKVPVDYVDLPEASQLPHLGVDGAGNDFTLPLESKTLGQHQNPLAGLDELDEEMLSPLDPYLETLQDMIDSNYDGLRNYNWLQTTINIQSALEKLINLSSREADTGSLSADSLHPNDLSLLKYIRSIYKTKKQSSASKQSRPSKHERKLKIPKSRLYKYNKYVDPWATMKKFRDEIELGSKTRASIDDDFKTFLLNVKTSLDDFHNVIKHIALATSFDQQDWFENIKDLYFRRPNRKNLMELLLHLSSARLFDLVEQSSLNHKARHAMGRDKYLMKRRVLFERTRREFTLVKRIVDELVDY